MEYFIIKYCGNNVNDPLSSHDERVKVPSLEVGAVLRDIPSLPRIIFIFIFFCSSGLLSRDQKFQKFHSERKHKSIEGYRDINQVDERERIQIRP